jgi:hypothetical protein
MAVDSSSRWQSMVTVDSDSRCQQSIAVDGSSTAVVDGSGWQLESPSKTVDMSVAGKWSRVDAETIGFLAVRIVARNRGS